MNEVGWDKGFETADNRLTILGPTDEIVAEAAGSKRQVADALLDAVLDSRRQPQPHSSRCPRTLAPSGEVDIIRYRTA